MSCTTADDNDLQDMPEHVHRVQMFYSPLMPLQPFVHASADDDDVRMLYNFSLLFPVSLPCPHMFLQFILRLSPVFPDIFYII